MDIALTRPQPIPVAKVELVGIKAVIAAATLYALCVLPPAIYLAHPAIRAWQRESRNRELLLGQSLTRLRQVQQSILAEALAIDDQAARIASLEEALAIANKDRVGYEKRVRGSQRSCDRIDTLFHRLTGNKNLALAREQVRDDQRFLQTVSRYVRDLEQTLQCSRQ